MVPVADMDTETNVQLVQMPLYFFPLSDIFPELFWFSSVLKCIGLHIILLGVNFKAYLAILLSVNQSFLYLG